MHEVPASALPEDMRTFNVAIRYMPKVACSEEKLVAEWRKMFPIVCKAWLAYQMSKTISAPTQASFYREKILPTHAPQMPMLAQLIVALLSITPGTGPLERSFTKLTKLCYKDRASIKSENLEVDYMLGVLNIKSEPILLKNAAMMLQKQK